MEPRNGPMNHWRRDIIWEKNGTLINGAETDNPVGEMTSTLPHTVVKS